MANLETSISMCLMHYVAPVGFMGGGNFVKLWLRLVMDTWDNMDIGLFILLGKEYATQIDK